jgi:SNF5 / SMARCB1 / INI1
MHLTSGWLLREQFVWDLSNPDNSPEDFASQLMLDYQQPQFGEDLNKVVFEIRRQIDSHCA